MVDSIKITALQDIGANIAYTTLIPVVNMAGTPTTQKANLQNLGNLILNGAGGSYFARAAQANLALSVANAAQPNITSVGTLTTLAVTGNITAGNINGGNIVVANFYYGDGGFLTNVVANSTYSNSNVANYLPTFTGNVGAGNVNVTGTVYANGLSSTGLASLTVLTVSTTANLGAVGNITITGGSNGQVLTTNGNGVLSWSNDANSSYGNSNVVTLLSAFGSNTITTTGNVSVGNANVNGLTSVTANLGNITFNGHTISTNSSNGNIDIVGSTSGNVHVDSNNHIFLHVNDSIDPHGGVEMTWERTTNGITQTAGVSVNSDFGNTELATGNVQIVACSNLATGLANSSWTFGTDGAFYLPGIGQKAILTGANSEMVLHSDTNLRFITDIYDSSRQFIFDSFGDFYAPGNVSLEGTTVLIGPGANALGLEGATLVISTTSDSYVQAIVNNVSDIGSADWVAQGHHGNDLGGWADLGFTSASYSDPAYTMFGPGTGYVIVNGYLEGQAPAIGTGSLVISTGTDGTEKDIIFGTGGSMSSDIFGRISHSNNLFELSRANSGIRFADGTTQSTAATGNIIAVNLTGSNTNVLYGNGVFAAIPAPAVAQDITSNGAMSIMTYDGNLKYVNYATVEPSTGNIAGGNISASGNVTANNFIGNGNTLSNVATKTSGSWTLASGVNTVSISVPLNGTYAIWVNGNIPNGIVTYTATAVVTNTNVPVLGEQYAWYYEIGNALVITSIPDQFVGTQGAISNASPYAGNTANVFTFGITNNSGNTAVVNYGYTKL